MFDPNEHRAECERYLGRFLGYQVKFVRAERLAQSTRAAPWRLDVEVNGIRRAFVLQLDAGDMEYEYRVLKAVESIPVPTPRAYGLDPQGESLGVPCFFSDFIAGEPLLGPLLAGEAWAENLYLDSVCTLQAVTEGDLGEIAPALNRTTAEDVLEQAYASLKSRALPLADASYRKLKAEMPALPAPRFSNGDLWPDNFLVREGKLAGVIDFENAEFSDPVFDFLLAFFVAPELRGRGIEERFCQRIGIDPAVLHWYHGLEYFDTWPWLLSTGENFCQHTAASVEANLVSWLGAND